MYTVSAVTTGEIDFIEFHDGHVESVLQRDNELVLVFKHLYVCLRSADDHAGWSYRATLELAGASNLTREGDLDPSQPRAEKERLPWVWHGAVLDASDAEIDPMSLLHGSAARRFWIFLYNDSQAVRISADIVRATLVLGEAVRRIEACGIVSVAPR